MILKRSVLNEKKQNILLNYFNFNKEKELVIYIHLCHGNLTHKQRKMLSYGPQFEGYQFWKSYIIDKFKVYSKPSLTELSRYLNLLLRNVNKLGVFIHGYWMAFISTFLTLSSNKLIEYLQLDLNPFFIFFMILCFVPLLVYFLISVYNDYSSQGQRESFYQDVKEIIDEMIEGK